MKEKVSVDLALRDSARVFFDYLESLPSEEVIVDFKDIISISRSFAHEYTTRKKISHKNIKEVNVPLNVRKMFSIVEEPREKLAVFDVRMVRAVSL